MAKKLPASSGRLSAEQEAAGTRTGWKLGAGGWKLTVASGQTNSIGDARAAGKTAPERLRSAIAEAAPAVRRFLFGMCGDWHQAEDLAQEALLRAWRSRERFDGNAAATTWLFTIARNAWRDSLRRRKVRPQVHAIQDITEPAGREPAPAAAAERGELAAAVAAAMAKLPDEQREALSMRESRGLKFEQIAALLGVPAATVKSRVRYALLKLADELRALGYGAETES